VFKDKLSLWHPKQIIENMRRFGERILNSRYNAGSDPFVINRNINRLNMPVIRRTLINCSLEEDEQNPYYTGVLNTLSNHCCGSIPIPIVLLEEDSICDAVEDRFQEWGVENEVGSAIRDLRRTAARSGIAVAIPYKMKTNHPIKLGFQVIGAEYFQSPGYNPDVYEGIEYWPNNDIKAVWIQEEGKLEPTRYKEEDIIVFTRKRVHKHWPECASAFNTYPSIRRYMTNILKSAENQTSIPMALELDPTYYTPFTNDLRGKFEYEPGFIPTLPPGAKLTGLNFAQVADDRSKFVDLMVGTAARCIDMPTILALSDSSDSNMATAHIDLQPWAYAVKIDRFDYEKPIRKIFWMWYNMATMWPGYLPRAAMKYPRPPIIFHYNVLFEHPDPVKRANAREADLLSGASTLTRIYSQDGLTARREIKKECKLLGITPEQYFKLLLASRSKTSASNQTPGENQNDPQQQRPSKTGVRRLQRGAS